MAKSKIKILIRVIGIWNESLITFLKEKPGIKKLYVIHKVTREKDHKDPKKMVDFKKISEEFLKRLNNEWGEIKVIPIILKDSQDFKEITDIVFQIVETEKIAGKGMLNTLEDIAIDFTGGTGLDTAGQLFAAFKNRITPYYVQPESVRKDNRVDKIVINYRMGREVGKPGEKILQNLAKSVFTVREFKGHTFFETPEGEDGKPVVGMKTGLELNREFKEAGMNRISGHLTGLIKGNFIEEGSGYEVYKNKAVATHMHPDPEPDWKIEPLENSKFYKITEAGTAEVNAFSSDVNLL